MVGTVTGATISGRVMARVTHYKRAADGRARRRGGRRWRSSRPSLAACPLLVLEVLLALSSIGLGTLLPVTTVAIQNAVMPHQMGTATGTMNFFRSLGGALIVAAFGAIVLGGLPQGAVEHVTLDTLPQSLAGAGLDIAIVFRWVFAAAAAGLLVTLGGLLAMEERPLRTRVHEQPVAAE